MGTIFGQRNFSATERQPTVGLETIQQLPHGFIIDPTLVKRLGQGNHNIWSEMFERGLSGRQYDPNAGVLATAKSYIQSL